MQNGRKDKHKIRSSQRTIKRKEKKRENAKKNEKYIKQKGNCLIISFLKGVLSFIYLSDSACLFAFASWKLCWCTNLLLCREAVASFVSWILTFPAVPCQLQRFPKGASVMHVL